MRFGRAAGDGSLCARCQHLGLGGGEPGSALAAGAPGDQDWTVGSERGELLGNCYQGTEGLAAYGRSGELVVAGDCSDRRRYSFGPNGAYFDARGFAGGPQRPV